MMQKARWTLGSAILVAFVLAFVAGCGNVGKTLKGGQAIAFAGAQKSERKARAQEKRADQLTGLQEAYQKYLQVIASEPDGKFSNRARYQAAIIRTELIVPGGANYDEAVKLLQEVADSAPTGYIGGLARTKMSAIQQNRQVVRDSQRVFDNTPEDAPADRQKAAAEALYNIARSFEQLNDYDTAIARHKQLIQRAMKYSKSPGDDFYKMAARSQFQIGNIYFYNLYDYVAGWPEYVKVYTDYKAAYEAQQTESLLKRAEAALTNIQQSQAYVMQHRNAKAAEFMKLGKRVQPDDLYSIYQEPVAQELFSIGRTWEADPLKNLPAAIKTYEVVVEELWTRRQQASEAGFQIARIYQDNGQYPEAIDAYDDFFRDFSDSIRRGEAVYNRAVCYETIREFKTAYEEYKAAVSLGEDTPFYRAADQKVRQMEVDEDGDGYKFYQEQQEGTSDKDPNAYPGKSKGPTADATSKN